MSTVYDAAVAREAELQEELKKVREFLGLYRAFMSQLQVESENNTGTNVPPSTAFVSAVDKVVAEKAREAAGADAAPPKRVRVSDNPKPTDVVAAAVALIRSNGVPMSRRQIWEALKADGMEVRGADPIKAVGTMLWRSGKDQLVQLEGRGYWIKDQPFYPAGYDPARFRRLARQTPSAAPRGSAT